MYIIMLLNTIKGNTAFIAHIQMINLVYNIIEAWRIFKSIAQGVRAFGNLHPLKSNSKSITTHCHTNA